LGFYGGSLTSTRPGYGLGAGAQRGDTKLRKTNPNDSIN
jgi:hypothetical protein